MFRDERTCGPEDEKHLEIRVSLGVRRWTENFFGFSKTIDGVAEFEAQILLDASFYTSHLFLE